MAGMSCMSSVCEPGASVNTALVLGRSRSAMPAPIARIVIGRLDAHPLQHGLGEVACGRIGRVGHQQMVARAERRHQRDPDRGEAGRDEHRSRGAGDVAPGLGQRVGRRRAVRAIGVALLAVLQRRDVGIEDGRSAERRDVDEALRDFAVTGQMGEAGADAQSVPWLRRSAFSSIGVSATGGQAK